MTITTLSKQFFASSERLKEKNRLPQFFRMDDDITAHDSITPRDMKRERGTRYSVSQHHIARSDDRERHTLECLIAPHRTTCGQRDVHITVSHSTNRMTWRHWEVHITVSHSTTSYKAAEGGTHYNISQHIVGPDGRERCSLHCLTAPHRTTGGQKKMYITMTHQARTSKNTGQALVSLRCPALSSNLYIDLFSKVSYACVQFHVHCDIFFSHWDVWFAEFTHRFSFSVWHSNVTVDAKRSMWSFRILIKT